LSEALAITVSRVIVELVHRGVSDPAAHLDLSTPVIETWWSQLKQSLMAELDLMMVVRCI